MIPEHPKQTPEARPPAARFWFWAGIVLTAAKLWLVAGQTIYAIGPAIHDDKLFINQAAHLLNGEWLGPYDQFTLAKGPLYSIFVAGMFWVGLPLLLAQQLFYIAASVVLVRSLTPWLRSAGLQFSLYFVLLTNPMSYDASNLTRLMRQSIYIPLAMLVIAGLIRLFARRREPWLRQATVASGAGLALGLFWITREESVWLLPAVGMLWGGVVLSLLRELHVRWRGLVAAGSCFLVAFLLPILGLSSKNYQHYGWFGTVEFRATEFKDAYGALSRISIDPVLPHVIVSRQMREAAYQVSPTFAKLQPYLEGEIGGHWVERELFPAEEHQIRGGWFMWALRDAMTAAGLTPSADVAMANYRKIAEEVNAACDDGRLPSTTRRSGFFPRITRDDIMPIWHSTLEYLDYFGAFRGFTAWSADSVGDYAELKPFRDYTGTQLSYAPRSPNPLPPEQSRLQRLQVSALESAGRFIAGIIAWAGPLLLVVGIARAIEAVWRRRVTFLLGLAGALLISVAAYLAINILITVTAFRNVSPGAMAAAYPLYLLALCAIAADALPAWSHAMVPQPVKSDAPRPSRWRWLTPAGIALVVWAVRMREIRLYGGDIPYNDQWIVEAWQIILPWLDGMLRPWTFFLPHFEHVPMWTRLLAWLEVVVSGRWDPLLQMTVNTTLYAGFAWLVARWVWRSFSPLAAGFITAVLVLGGTLPHAWENIAWGFQSQFPTALLFMWWHVQDSIMHPPGSRRWWLAQAAGVAGLFTLASMWIAPLAIVAMHFWTKQGDRRGWRAPAIIAGCGLLMLAVVHGRSDLGHTFAQTTTTVMDFVHSVLHLLGWPSGLPGSAGILLLPSLIHAARLRGTTQPSKTDRIIFTLGVINFVHAIGIAFSRTGDNGDYVSRYGDVFFIGTLAGALALIRLCPALEKPRLAWFTLSFAWAGLVVGGLFQHATEGHARYFHRHAADNAHIRRIAVQAYMHDGDASLLEQGGTRRVLTQSTEVVTSLLDRAEFRALLPASVLPGNADTSTLRGTRWLLDHWPWFFGAGLLIFCAGLAVLRYRGGARSPAPLDPAPASWSFRLCTAVCLTSFGALLFWTQPVFTDRDVRWQKLLGGDAAIQGMTFDFSQPMAFPPERIQGAAPVGPVELRNRLHGTAPAGPALTCTIFSSPFTVTHDWLIIPYAGYPIGVGNGLRVQLLTPDGGQVEREIECLPPNIEGLGYCPVDLKSVRGRRVRLVLYDGRVDTEAWVAVAPPIPANTPELAATLAQKLHFEQHSSLPVSLIAIGVLSLAGAVVARRRATGIHR
jgi:hypothetical protein